MLRLRSVDLSAFCAAVRDNIFSVDVIGRIIRAGPRLEVTADASLCKPLSRANPAVFGVRDSREHVVAVGRGRHRISVVPRAWNVLLLHDGCRLYERKLVNKQFINQNKISKDAQLTLDVHAPSLELRGQFALR